MLCFVGLVSATGRSLIQRNPADCVCVFVFYVIECDKVHRNPIYLQRIGRKDHNKKERISRYTCHICTNVIKSFPQLEGLVLNRNEISWCRRCFTINSYSVRHEVSHFCGTGIAYSQKDTTETNCLQSSPVQSIVLVYFLQDTF